MRDDQPADDEVEEEDWVDGEHLAARRLAVGEERRRRCKQTAAGSSPLLTPYSSPTHSYLLLLTPYSAPHSIVYTHPYSPLLTPYSPATDPLLSTDPYSLPTHPYSPLLTPTHSLLTHPYSLNTHSILTPTRPLLAPYSPPTHSLLTINSFRKALKTHALQ